MLQDKELKLFEYLEQRKDKLYQLENQNLKLKTTKAQLKLLKEIYKFCGFNFQKIAFLRQNEKKKWTYYSNLFRKKHEERTNTQKLLKIMLFVFKRLRNYDVLKIKNTVYNLNT